MDNLNFFRFFSHLMINLVVLGIFTFTSFTTLYSQTSDNYDLQSKSYIDLESLYDATPHDSIKLKKRISSIYLSKAKRDQDTVNIGRAYYLFSALYNSPTISKQYADSIITATKNINHQAYPALGYFLKGYWCYQLSEYQQSLHNYLKGDSIARSKGNIKQSIENRNMIALLKSRAGDYRGALRIYLKEIDSLALSKSLDRNDYADYLNRLYNASLNYMHLNELDSANIYSRRGLKESLQIKDSIYYFDFLYNLGVIAYLDGNKPLAENNIDKALPYLDDYSKAMAYYYKGDIATESYVENEALFFFRTSDSIAEELNYTFPELRKVYEYFVEHYEKKEDLVNQLVYVNKLLKLDSTLTHSKDLQLEIENKYDRPILLNKKQTIIEILQNKNQSKNIIIGLFIILTVSLVLSVYFYRKKQITYLKKFNSLVKQNKRLSIVDERSIIPTSDSIPPDIYDKINIGLRKFEDQEEYLKPITLLELAIKLETNTSYLSKFINISTKKNFSQYLNFLRINYITERLKIDTKLRSYTVKAIAKEIGYGTAQPFAKAFFQQTGIYPSYYIAQLNNE